MIKVYRRISERLQKLENFYVEGMTPITHSSEMTDEIHHLVKKGYLDDSVFIRQGEHYCQLDEYPLLLKGIRTQPYGIWFHIRMFVLCDLSALVRNFLIAMILLYLICQVAL